MIENPPDWARITFLVVEDVDNNFEYVNTLLMRTKAKVIRALEGNEAIEIFMQHPEIDIVLMDIQLPGMDGIEATREIKKIRPEIPVLGQTAYALKSDIELMQQSQLDDFVTKPVRPNDLLIFISKYVSSSNTEPTDSKTKLRGYPQNL